MADIAAHDRLTPASPGFPEIYKSKSTGDCLGAALSGSVKLVSALEEPRDGDIVVLWLKPGVYSDGTEGDCIGHRVARGEACIVKILFKQDASTVTVMQLNPFATVTIPRHNVVAMHKAVAVQPAGSPHFLRLRKAAT
ncbi:hypothetical protein [Mesorhizobium kowhaii]|uniref:Peptidase S24/S26A/S26B/S26C domain-containing protein n=1 Tax=Mesorhizobium kowhaii TaxID=1300272 RepID=A0A2W7CDY2_9HYPH|nr:hypothetical protein [Mesorhizobium kowhaii]PZV39748.1 hypothetical protein B5V02_07415 [Mesorhizobium kowhaii]